MVVRGWKGKGARMLDHHTFLVFEEDPRTAPGRAGGSVDKDDPLVLLSCGGVMRGHLPDEIGQSL